jgi:nitroreductase
MWLMATTLGISVQVLSALSAADSEAALHQILDIPGHMQIAFACRLGYPTVEATKYLRVRREVAEFTHCNRYAAKTGSSPAQKDREPPAAQDSAE